MPFIMYFFFQRCHINDVFVGMTFLMMFFFTYRLMNMPTNYKRVQPKKVLRHVPEPLKFEDFSKLQYLKNVPSEFISSKLDWSGVMYENADVSDFEDLVELNLLTSSHSSDLEIVDMLEQFFWGNTHGVVMEVGVGNSSESMTDALEWLGWKRILVEGNPRVLTEIVSRSRNAIVIGAPICSRKRIVHYLNTSDEKSSGIVEFMNREFLFNNYYKLYELMKKRNEHSEQEWKQYPNIISLECVPLSLPLQDLGIKHINFLLLDVEGAELDVLRSINWSKLIIDVICVENEAEFRPVGNDGALIAYLYSKGFTDASGQQGRNRWFKRDGFIPNKRFSFDLSRYRGANRRFQSKMNNTDHSNHFAVLH